VSAFAYISPRAFGRNEVTGQLALNATLLRSSPLRAGILYGKKLSVEPMASQNANNRQPEQCLINRKGRQLVLIEVLVVAISFLGYLLTRQLRPATVLLTFA